ncbi:HNH endonuclease [Micromonospora maris]|uniref:HNH endonuclease n=1 Tax=Micromonospora maris TaxID=1003110 RepID=UPI002E10F1F4|nr:HNH endonuclease [Micromonospora maris]WSK41957.1 HNH endonuclease [Micromonospora maris]
MAGNRRGMPTLYGIVQYWRVGYEKVFPNLKASYIGWGEPFCFRCGWLAPVDDTQATLAAVWNSAQGWLDRAHLQDLALGGSNQPENLVPLCRQCHDIMDPCETRVEAIAYINDGIPVDSWWQMHTDTIFGSETNHYSPTHKTKLMRDLYVRWVENNRVIEAARRGNPQAVRRVEVLLEQARRRAEAEGRHFSYTIEDLK